jgi:hypothetical protein
MQQHAGLLFLAKNTRRVLLILENQKWTVPTFERNTVLVDDAANLLLRYSSGKLLPIELYLSKDKGFEYATYVCLVDSEFLTTAADTVAWCSLEGLPRHLHSGLKTTLHNSIIRTKIETILELKL